MLVLAGAENIVSEFEEWSKPEMFWNIRKDREVKSYKRVMSFSQKFKTAMRIRKQFGIRGILKVFQNEKIFFQTILKGELGYCLFKGTK